MTCNICGSSVRQFFKSNSGVSISSDLRVIRENISVYKCTSCHHLQKLQNEEIDKIYDEYKKDDLIEGEDQIKFVDGKPFFRTDIITENIKSYLNSKNSLLDVGTGTGVFLKSCDKKFNMELYAFDLSSIHKEHVLDIGQVQKFYTNDINTIEKNFDAVSLIHVLEHIKNPVEFLKDLKTRLNEDGILIVQVPNININTNDILIYDHMSHFNKSTLYKLVKQIFSYVHFITTPLHNEITLVASDYFDEDLNIKDEDIKLNFEYINTVNNFLKSISEPIYIFGTAPISTYFAAILNENDMLKGFIDEDKLKVGKYYLNKLVNHPKQLRDIKCFIPLDESVSKKIKNRYNDIEFISIEDIK